jgi:hypothetical protein
MPRRSELSNVYDRLQDFDEDLLRVNYLFMKQAPMYVSLEKKYKETKKKNRELKRMIDLLNRQNMELMERCANQRHLETTTECMLSERFSKLPKLEPEDPEVEVVFVKKENIVCEILEDEVEEVVVEETEEVVVEETEEVVVEETEEVVEEQVVEEQVVEEQVVEEETEEVVEEQVVEEETEEVVEEEVVEETEEEQVVEEQVVEEQVVEEQVEEEDEGEELYEITINGTRYYVSNETDSTIYAVSEDDEVGEEVGSFVDGKPTFQASAEEQEQEHAVEEEEEEEGVYEITINGNRYYVSNETDSTIYAVAEDDEIGDEVGAFVNGVAKLNA